MRWGSVGGWVALVVVVAACDVESTAPRDPYVSGVEIRLPWRARALSPIGRDATVDVALALELDDAVLVLDGSQVGALSIGDTVDVGRGPRALSRADVDGDGADELIAANTGESTLSVLAREPVGGGKLAVTEQVVLAAPPTQVAAGDVDGDGRDELLVSLGLGDDAGVELWAAGPDGMQRRQRLAADGGGRARLVDLDGTGGVDAIALFPTGGRVALFVEADGSLELRATLPVCATPLAVTVADIDDDGAADVVVTCRDGGLTLIFDAAGAPQIDDLVHDGGLYETVAIDADGDGHVDLAAADVTQHSVAVWLGLPEGGFVGPTLHPVARGPIAIVAADLERDGDADLIALSIEESAVSVLDNVGAAGGTTTGDWR